MRALLDDLRAGLGELAPGRFPYRRFIGALLIGAAGGWLFAWLRLPLPWMLGSMTACTLAALLKAPIAAPTVVRPPMTMVIGVMLGAGFSPAIIGQLPGWLPTLLGLVAFIATCGLACVAYFRRVARLDPVTAYFAGMPGGLVEMVMVGEDKGGDARTIALIHSARILLIVLTLPFVVQTIGGVTLGARAQAGMSVLDTPFVNELWLLVTALVGAVAGRALRLPAAYLLGPMLVSATVHVLGLTDFVPPREVLNVAQLVLGTTIGCRFLGTPPGEILRILWLSIGSTLILLATTVLFAFAVSRVSAHGVVPLMLAYSPGGLAEMSLIALALQIEVAFVAAHHVVRVFLVMVGAGPVFALMRGRAP
ncbi:AbrB family transcriptional regulator [Salinarimonas soli]|uniref:AbrB family transcriptional regulator n=1 Tax=Salinarimonas soli TaxID=1638099 RepID=A0A5B2VAZ2_9HYPH|nr:AbrB family transcriptional regulator [Salinarimonas soli]KAA2235610.1 AbrB family transcriptional regulator [Salinarimonas soli]